MSSNISCTNCSKEIRRYEAYVHETDEADTYQLEHSFCQTCISKIRNSICPKCSFSLIGKNINSLSALDQRDLEEPPNTNPNEETHNTNLNEDPCCSFKEGCIGCATPLICLVILIAVNLIIREASSFTK